MIGSPISSQCTRLVLLGGGELGKEVVIEAMRLGCETVVFDRYADSPAMQVAHRSRVVSMTDPAELREALEAEIARPHAALAIVPEIEAIATEVLIELEAGGVRVVPTARGAQLTMDREGIRQLAAEQLEIKTSPYRFCSSLDEVVQAVNAIGVPCVIKPVMSSSGKGQSTVDAPDEVDAAWKYAQTGARVSQSRVIVEGFIDFDYEITLLTVRHKDGTSFCAPIGHRQEDGDYRESWQPQPMSEGALSRAHEIATAVTDALGGHGIFGVELFVKGDQVWFSEVSPRPHDTGLVTITSQRLSEFALHVRAILGLPIPVGVIGLESPAASAVILGESELDQPAFFGTDEALSVDPSIDLRLFGKPTALAGRRLGVVTARAATTDEARRLATEAAACVRVGSSDDTERKEREHAGPARVA